MRSRSSTADMTNSFALHPPMFSHFHTPRVPAFRLLASRLRRRKRQGVSRLSRGQKYCPGLNLIATHSSGNAGTQIAVGMPLTLAKENLQSRTIAGPGLASRDTIEDGHFQVSTRRGHMLHIDLATYPRTAREMVTVLLLARLLPSRPTQKPR